MRPIDQPAAATDAMIDRRLHVLYINLPISRITDVWQ